MAPACRARRILLGPAQYGRHVDTVQGLDLTTIACCHSPVIEGPFIEQAFDRVRQFPSMEAPPLPDQSILDEIVAATSVHA